MANIFLAYLKETLEAINQIIASRNQKIVTVKRLRKMLKIKSKNRSRINFFWRSLRFLEKQGILIEVNPEINPKSYILPKKVINVQKIIEGLN